MPDDYEYNDLPWAGLLQWSCQARFQGLGHKGKCELKRKHPNHDHAAERGMEWVRFDNYGHIWLTMAGSSIQDRYW